MAQSLPLRDKRILIVEDEYFLADELERYFIGIGATVLGPVPSVAKAIALIDAEPTVHAAVLDVNLGGEISHPVADALVARSIPFVLATGYSDGELEGRFPQIIRCEKPFEFRKLLEALTKIILR